MAYVNTACAGRVTIFSIGGKFRPGSNFTYLHALTLAACSCALLVSITQSMDVTISLLGPTRNLAEEKGREEGGC